MVVALRALNGEAQHALADGVHAIEHRLHAELLGIDAAFLVDHRIAQESSGDDLVLGRIGQHVAGNLLDDELVVGQVAVEGVDHPVAIEPDLPRLVFLKAVGVGIAGGIEPEARPALSIMRRGEQALNEAFISRLRLGGRFLQEPINLFNRRRQPDQVEREAADQRHPVRLGGRLEPFFLKARENEGVDRIRQRLAADFRRIGAHGDLKRPVTPLRLVGKRRRRVRGARDDRPGEQEGKKDKRDAQVRLLVAMAYRVG